MSCFYLEGRVSKINSIHSLPWRELKKQNPPSTRWIVFTFCPQGSQTNKIHLLPESTFTSVFCSYQRTCGLHFEYMLEMFEATSLLIFEAQPEVRIGAPLAHSRMRSWGRDVFIYTLGMLGKLCLAPKIQALEGMWNQIFTMLFISQFFSLSSLPWVSWVKQPWYYENKEDAWTKSTLKEDSKCRELEKHDKHKVVMLLPIKRTRDRCPWTNMGHKKSLALKNL